MLLNSQDMAFMLWQKSKRNIPMEQFIEKVSSMFPNEYTKEDADIFNSKEQVLCMLELAGV